MCSYRKNSEQVAKWTLCWNTLCSDIKQLCQKSDPVIVTGYLFYQLMLSLSLTNFKTCPNVISNVG